MSATPPPVSPSPELNPAPQSAPQPQTPPAYNPAPPRPVYVPESRYSLSSVVGRFFILFAISILATVISYSFDILANSRHALELLSGDSCDKVVNSTSYCFALMLITLSTLLLLDLRFRKPINNLQYVLVGGSILCFYLLMLSFAEHIDFAIAFTIASLMIISLIGWFTQGLMQRAKATASIVSVLVVEYLILVGLLYIGSFALLAGSLVLFALIALAMYFTLRMKIVNNELFIGTPNE